MAIQQDSQEMIDPPEGFDARSFSPMQLSSAGILRRLVPNSNWIKIASYVSPRRVVASRPPLVLRSSQPGAGTTSNFLSTRGNSSRLGSAGPRLSIWRRHSRIPSTAGASTTARPDTVATRLGPNMVRNCSRGT